MRKDQPSYRSEPEGPITKTLSNPLRGQNFSLRTLFLFSFICTIPILYYVFFISIFFYFWQRKRLRQSFWSHLGTTVQKVSHSEKLSRWKKKDQHELFLRWLSLLFSTLAWAFKSHETEYHSNRMNMEKNWIKYGFSCMYLLHNSKISFAKLHLSNLLYFWQFKDTTFQSSVPRAVITNYPLIQSNALTGERAHSWTRLQSSALTVELAYSQTCL